MYSLNLLLQKALKVKSHFEPVVIMTEFVSKICNFVRYTKFLQGFLYVQCDPDYTPLLNIELTLEGGAQNKRTKF